MRKAIAVAITLTTLTVAIQSIAQTPPPAPTMPPSLPAEHVVNVMTNEGSGAFSVQWRVADVRIVEVPAAINKDRYKTTYQIEPRAMPTDFDDSQWERIEGKDLGVRRSGVTCGCPIAAGDGHDFPRLIDERVPSVAAVIDDIVEGLENSVRQPVLPHELPDIFLAVEFGCAWRELQERDVVWNLEGLGAMPAGLIEEENSVSARSEFGCDLIEVKLHSFGVAGRQHEGGAGSAVGADRTEQVGRLGPLIVGGTGA